MAKVTFTITDLDDGTFAISTEFDPPIPRGVPEADLEATLTHAQKMALYAIASVTEAVEETGGGVEFRGPAN